MKYQLAADGDPNKTSPLKRKTALMEQIVRIALDRKTRARGGKSKTTHVIFCTALVKYGFAAAGDQTTKQKNSPKVGVQQTGAGTDGKEYKDRT